MDRVPAGRFVGADRLGNRVLYHMVFLRYNKLRNYQREYAGICTVYSWHDLVGIT
jgi:hypothetical protein